MNAEIIGVHVASASAPTYFKAWTMEVMGQKTVLVDGGVGVTGNPVYQACVEAFYYDDFTPSETRRRLAGDWILPVEWPEAERAARLA